MKRSKSRGPSGPKARPHSSTGSSTSSPAKPDASERLEAAPAAAGAEAAHGGPGSGRRLRLAAHPLDLHGLDTLGARDLLVFVRPDERPLQGLAGLADWRLLGRLNRLLREGLFEGRVREALLTVGAPRLPAQRVFLYGLGDKALEDALAPALAMVGRAGGLEVACAPFGDTEHLVERAERVASAARDAGIERLVCLADRVEAAHKALVVVEAHHPWAVLD